MKVRVLGSGAGGGFPQWNCNCHNCARFRKGEFRGHARTQSSIAVQGTEGDWILLNCSPDVRTQLESFPESQPARALRDSALGAVLVIDSQIDHTTGLLMLRESANPIEFYCTDRVYEDLTTGFPVLNVLEHYCGVQRHSVAVAPARPFTVARAPGLRLTAVALHSKAPPYSPHREAAAPGDNIGLRIEDLRRGTNMFYAPGLGRFEPHLEEYLSDADCLLVDGTFWREDEMAWAGISSKTASEMGHLPQSGPGGMIELLRPLTKPRKVLIHINNTNPILDEDSEERQVLTAEGIEVAYDGMEIML